MNVKVASKIVPGDAFKLLGVLWLVVSVERNEPTTVDLRLLEFGESRFTPVHNFVSYYPFEVINE